MAVAELTDENFAAAVADGVVMVDFYGTYCPPCRLLEPVMDELAAEYDGRARLARINVDEHSEAAVANAVADIPTIIFYRGGTEVSRVFGAQARATLAAELDRLLS